MKTIIANVDYLCGHLRYGHFELYLTDEDYKKFKELSEEDKISWIKDDGSLIIDDFELNDYGDLTIVEE